MNTRPLILLVLTLSLFGRLAVTPARADGEPTGYLSDTGVIVPVDEANASVLYQKVTVTMPRRERWPKPAQIRADYVLRNRSGRPLTIAVGWPTTGLEYQDDMQRKTPYQPAIKLDGKPVASRWLPYPALVRQMEGPWRQAVDRKLQARPALYRQVLAIRKEGKRYSPSGQAAWMEAAGATRLTDWMIGHGYAITVTIPYNNVASTYQTRISTERVAKGLLGNGADINYQPGDAVQTALKWLDPKYRPVEGRDVLLRRWGFQQTLLNPSTRRLEDMRGPILYDPEFGVFVFRITLLPGRQHRLAVQYAQELGLSGLTPGEKLPDPDFYGLVYLMGPSKRWGEWKKTEIEVRVPKGWRRSGIRPTARRAGTSSGYRIYRTTMDGRPHTDLWVSVAP